MIVIWWYMGKMMDFANGALLFGTRDLNASFFSAAMSFGNTGASSSGSLFGNSNTASNPSGGGNSLFGNTGVSKLPCVHTTRAH